MYFQGIETQKRGCQQYMTCKGFQPTEVVDLDYFRGTINDLLCKNAPIISLFKNTSD
jgi:hypothetical protein